MIGSATVMNLNKTESNTESHRIILKGKDTIMKSWTYEGKLYAQMKNGKIEPVTSKDYSKWLALDWPEKN